LFSLAASPLKAQDYPTRTITFICPFPAGGGSDVFARMLAQELQDKLKQTVIVENRVGAGTVIAAQATARSAPDGHTLFLAPVTTLAIGPSIYKSLPYDTVKDCADYLSLVQLACREPIAWRQHASELIAIIKRRSGELSWYFGRPTPHHRSWKCSSR
jgi:tripartite-type tricarboxylate transporter receptor subunit TctC